MIICFISSHIYISFGCTWEPIQFYCIIQYCYVFCCCCCCCWYFYDCYHCIQDATLCVLCLGSESNKTIGNAKEMKRNFLDCSLFQWFCYLSMEWLLYLNLSGKTSFDWMKRKTLCCLCFIVISYISIFSIFIFILITEKGSSFRFWNWIDNCQLPTNEMVTKKREAREVCIVV